MTIATTATLAGDTWTNVFTEETLMLFQFQQSGPSSLSVDKSTLTFSFVGGDTAEFFSDAGFVDNLNGTINGVDTGDTQLSALSYDLLTFLQTVRDGDLDAINRALWGGADTINGGASDDTIFGFGGADMLYGNDGNDTINGGTGSDRIFGGNGNDIMVGAIGNDKLTGGAGNDRMSGGAGNDVLQGGTGFDQMNGGSGVDTFRFTNFADFGAYNPSNAFAADFIRDFAHNDGDLIDLRSLDANSTMGGNQDFTFIGTAAFHAGTPGEVRVQQVNPNSPFLWQVQLSTDSDNGVEYAFVMIAFNGAPVAADFVL
ncbi:calcium-binding protein [Novosphingobium cyanobacteriorum]|uniref:Calcium-binding protein n=1 Tax=Novosphingobium cyanobacteriorum TaxID=3024215 RepID=A0ABT6CJ38_9SPHN|nr:calcium-binding protein [Novosphingobium cyanobacteriorum]MDF8333303.1 calcium-binding protein [Novosphingobium cyanobacteriorum]